MHKSSISSDGASSYAPIGAALAIIPLLVAAFTALFCTWANATHLFHPAVAQAHACIVNITTGACGG